MKRVVAPVVKHIRWRREATRLRDSDPFIYD